MSVISSDQDKERLYSDLFGVTLNYLSKDQIENINANKVKEAMKRCINRLHSGSDYTRADLALRLYWELSTGKHVDLWPVQPYLEYVREQVEMQSRKSEPAVSLRDYWMK